MQLFAFSIALATALAGQAPQVEEEEGPGFTPWQAQIYSSFQGWSAEELKKRPAWDLAHKCGGSLIAPSWVLTAAHCISEERIRNGHRVRLGADYIDKNEGITYRIDRMVRHADWNKKDHLYDIALVHFVPDELTNAVKVGPIEVIPLYDGPPLNAGVDVFATGWGQNEEGKDTGFQAQLTSVDLRTADCAKFPQYAGKLRSYQMCASSRTPDDDSDTCTGDSGGPLVLDVEKPVLVGIVNWGIGCYREHSAGIYLRIDHDNFRDWIARAMAAEPSVSELR